MLEQSSVWLGSQEQLWRIHQETSGWPSRPQSVFVFESQHQIHGVRCEKEIQVAVTITPFETYEIYWSNCPLWIGNKWWCKIETLVDASHKDLRQGALATNMKKDVVRE